MTVTRRTPVALNVPPSWKGTLRFQRHGELIRVQIPARCKSFAYRQDPMSRQVYLSLETNSDWRQDDYIEFLERGEE